MSCHSLDCPDRQHEQEEESNRKVACEAIESGLAFDMI